MALETAAEIEARLRDSGGVPVTYAGTPTYGHEGVADEVFLEQLGVMGELRTVTVATGILANLAMDAAITVDGTDYEVRGHRRVDGGALTEIALADA